VYGLYSMCSGRMGLVGAYPYRSFKRSKRKSPTFSDREVHTGTYFTLGMCPPRSVPGKPISWQRSFPRHAAVGHAASSSTDAHAEQPGKRLRVSFSTSASADEVDVRGGHARHVLANSANNIGAPQTTPGPHLAANLSANSVVTCPFSYLNGR
jgi:hypothetical protein